MLYNIKATIITIIIIKKYQLVYRCVSCLCRFILGNEVWSHHALHAVRQQQDYAVLTDPLGLSGTDKLVDYTLGRIVEVTKLGLPQNQSIRTGHGKSQLET